MRFAAAGLALTLAVASASPAHAYSVLAHEAAIDALWDSHLQPLMLRRFPGISSEELLRARSFAYGGSVIQDLGYYPFGNHFFSNLLHYVRSGDFVERLIRDARDVNEYAFALGALAHYTNDNAGHPLAVNRAVPVSYPKLRKKYGSEVTYVEAPKEHVIVEFSFDIVQVSDGAYLPDAYRRFIGFEVATPLLERAFRDTYGLETRDIFSDEARALSTYRYAVSQIVPAITQAAWRDKHDEITRLSRRLSRSDFVFAYSRADFERSFGTNYQKPGVLARFIAALYRIVPKIGPLRPLAFKAPTAETERLFAESFRAARARYSAALHDVRAGRLNLRNTNFDTGKHARHGDYALADDTYAELLERLSRRRFDGAPKALRQDIRAFYGPRPGPSETGKSDRKHWNRLSEALAALPD